MGSLVNNICYETTALAVDAYYSAKEPYFYMAGTTAYFSYYSKEATSWSVERGSWSSAGDRISYTSVPAQTPSFPTCTFETPATNEAKFADGVTIGWGIAAAMAIAYSYKLIQRSIS